MLKLDNFYKARYELSKVIRQTEVVQAPQVNPECDVYLKLECLQRTGSFKVRGACYKISQLSNEEKAHGVIACSAGNHAQGVALGATAHGIKSLICLPAGAPISKVEATKGYGADVCLVPGVYDDAYQKAIELRDEKGLTREWVAEHSETGLRHLAAIELGEKNPSVDTLYRIIRCIGVSSDRIFYPEQSEHNSDLEDISFLAATCTHKERQMIVAFIRMLLDYRD